MVVVVGAGGAAGEVDVVVGGVVLTEGREMLAMLGRMAEGRWMELRRKGLTVARLSTGMAGMSTTARRRRMAGRRHMAQERRMSKTIQRDEGGKREGQRRDAPTFRGKLQRD